MKNSHIEWTDHTFNPWEGCTKVSPGCLHCYAETRDIRFTGGMHWGKGAPRRRTSTQNWNGPRRWDKEAASAMEEWCRASAGKDIPAYKIPARPRVFCASLADWLDDEVPIEWLADLLELIRDTPNLDWQLLTKRPENWDVRLLAVDEYQSGRLHYEAIGFVRRWLSGTPPANVWIGTTVEDQQRADERIPILLKIPSRVRFLSCEPLLEAVDLVEACGGAAVSVRLDWVICGGESGPKARPMHPDWARSLRDQCAAAGVAFFFKQWGEWSPDKAPCVLPTHWLWKSGHIEEYGQPNASSATREGAVTISKHGKIVSGRLLDGIEHKAFPDVSA